MNREEANARAGILKAIGHPARILIIDELSRGDRCGRDLLPLCGVDQSVLSRHLAQLRHAGVITEQKKGVKVIYHLECVCILQALDCTLGVLKAEARRKGKLANGSARKPQVNTGG